MLSSGVAAMSDLCFTRCQNRLDQRIPQSLPLNSRSSSRTFFAELILILAMLAVIAPPASAQENKDGGDVSDSATKKSGASLPNPFDDTWRFALGAGAINGPRYPGSRDNFTRGAPLASVSYGRYFIGAIPGGGTPAGAGAYLLHTEHWMVGADIGGDFRQPRRASDDPILRGWGDIPRTVRGGMFASYTMDWLSASGSISGDLGNHHEGVIASFSLSAKCHPAPGLTLSIGPEVTWVNDQYAKTFFGIDAAQAEIAQIQPYRARGGINTVGGSANAAFRFSKQWSVGSQVRYGRLQGDAADSPVTTDKSQRTFAAFVIYRF
jgi:outer membrane protein